MMQSKYSNSVSFTGKTRIVLVLLGIIPVLLVIYLFVYERINITDMIVFFAALALLSILAGFSLLRSSADSLAHLARMIGSIGSGEMNDPIHIRGDQEITDIAAHVNSVIVKLQEAQRGIKDQSVQLMLYARDISESYKKIKEEIELRNRLSRYVGENLVEKLIHSQDEVFLDDERKEVSILFADIRSFTTIAEKMAAEQVVALLNEFFNLMVDIVFQHHGILDKFIGDQLMATFGLMPSENHHSFDALSSAMAMQDATEALMSKRATQGKETFAIGIGINSGSAIVGNVGSENRMDYTTIGNMVNVAARLQQIAKGGEILMGEDTYLQVKGQCSIRKKGKISVKNKAEPILCYECVRRDAD
jgi:adenylate cyclase